jgi:uncharacterized protein YaiI (UPF0178 family)
MFMEGSQERRSLSAGCLSGEARNYCSRPTGIPVIMVSSTIMLKGEERRLNRSSDRGADSADLYIANHISAGALSLPRLWPAALALGKRCKVLSNRGQSMKIPQWMLKARAERRRGHYSKGPKAIPAEEKNLFQHKLTKLLTLLQENVQL